MVLGERVFGLLPSIEELIAENRTERVTLNLSSDTLEFLRKKAKKSDYPYQQLIRNVLDKFVELETRA